MSGRLTVSLSALAANYRRLCASASGQVAAVVKADGYGLGAVPVASRLRQEGCGEFFVATAGEGAQLRQALPDAPIYVLEGVTAQSVDTLVASELTPVLNTPTQCSLWMQTGRAAAVHVDTGMQRLGLPFQTAAQSLAESNLPLQLFISHFARADEPGHASVQEQMARALPVYQALRERYPELRLSLCNSAALLEGLGPEDLGRAGIALYGGNPFDALPNPMRPVVSMHAQVLQLRQLEAGVPVGYGGAYVTSAPARLAVLGVGYADGLPRALSNRGEVVLHGCRCPIVGRVSMDLTVVDASAVDVQEGDMAEVFGEAVAVDEVAAHAGTIAYEILTGLSRRMSRSYLA